MIYEALSGTESFAKRGQKAALVSQISVRTGKPLGKRYGIFLFAIAPCLAFRRRGEWFPAMILRKIVVRYRRLTPGAGAWNSKGRNGLPL